MRISQVRHRLRFSWLSDFDCHNYLCLSGLTNCIICVPSLDNASTSSDSTMAATDSSRNNYQSTCHLEERCCKLTADSPYTFNKNFEDKEDLFEEILYILKGKTVTEEQGQLLEKKYTSDFRDMVPLLKQYHEAIQYSKKTYDECWKIGRMKEESKFQLKTIPNKYLLLCLYSGAFCGADRAALKQICKDLVLDFSVKQAVIRWGLQRYYPKVSYSLFVITCTRFILFRLDANGWLHGIYTLSFGLDCWRARQSQTFAWKTRK